MEDCSENVENYSSENVNNEANCIDGADPIVPQRGMKFQSEDEVKRFYCSYAENLGFGICKSSTKYDDNGKQKYFSYGCTQHRKHNPTGMSKLNCRPLRRIDCKAKINVSIIDESTYILNSVVLDHNHELCPNFSRYFPCHRRLDSLTKKTLDMNDQAGIRTSKSFASMVIKAGGYDQVAFNERDCWNYMSSSRVARLGVGDARVLCDYFVRMHKRNPNFYHVIDYDDECRIRNIFWADARSRAAYESFSDVITFDSTYLTNKYKMPFVPFVGINHHGQSILLGCGLLSNENIETYIWLFRAWLDCMLDHKPDAIVTDQCQAIQAAISVVFPDTRHRLYLWHIMKKIPEKFGSFKRYKEIKRQLKSIVYDCNTVVEFEEKWLSMIQEFSLHKNEWLSSLYDDRRRWVPVFVKETFWAGMSTTQRSESMNAYFDDYVNHRTSLKQFVEQYDFALKRKIENEEKADFSSINSRIPLMTNFTFEKQFQDTYTNNIFGKFQDEIKGLMFCNVSSVLEEFDICDGTVRTCDVSDISRKKDGSFKKVLFSIFFYQSEVEVRCLCHLFESCGILCKHCLKVLVDNDITENPSRYIVDRWRKDIKRKHNFVKNCYSDVERTEEDRRYDDLQSLFCSLAEVSVKSSQKILHAKKSLQVLNEEVMVSDSYLYDASNPNELGVCSRSNVRSPLRVRSKGRPATKRKESKIYKPKSKRSKKVESSHNVG